MDACPSFVHVAVTGVLVDQRTYYRNGRSLAAVMQRHNSATSMPSCAAISTYCRRLSSLNCEGIGERVGNSYSATPDRLRAACATLGALPPSPSPPLPAHMMFTTPGASDAETVELDLAKVLFNPKEVAGSPADLFLHCSTMTLICRQLIQFSTRTSRSLTGCWNRVRMLTQKKGGDICCTRRRPSVASLVLNLSYQLPGFTMALIRISEGVVSNFDSLTE